MLLSYVEGVSGRQMGKYTECVSRMVFVIGIAHASKLKAHPIQSRCNYYPQKSLPSAIMAVSDRKLRSDVSCQLLPPERNSPNAGTV